MLLTHRNLCENQYLDKPNSIILEITRKQPNFQQINTAFIRTFIHLAKGIYIYYALNIALIYKMPLIQSQTTLIHPGNLKFSKVFETVTNILSNSSCKIKNTILSNLTSKILNQKDFFNKQFIIKFSNKKKKIFNFFFFNYYIYFFN